MISNHDIERIATAVVRKQAEAELDRLTRDLEMERKLAAYEDEQRALKRKQEKRRRLFGVLKLVLVLVLALLGVILFEALQRQPVPQVQRAGSPSAPITPAR